MVPFFLSYCSSDRPISPPTKQINVVLPQQDSTEADGVYCKGNQEPDLTVDEQALLTAAIKNNLVGVQGLLNKNVCPNLQDKIGFTPLHWAARWGYFDLLKELLNVGGADPNIQDNYSKTALHYAARYEYPEKGYGYLDIVKELLKARGIQIDIKDSDGFTPFALGQL